MLLGRNGWSVEGAKGSEHSGWEIAVVEGRKALDARVEVRHMIFDNYKMIHVEWRMLGFTQLRGLSLFVHQKMLEEMEEALGVWRTLLLPLTSDPELEVQVKCFQKALKGTKITQDILKVCGISLHLY